MRAAIEGIQSATDKAVGLWVEGDKSKALKIFATFKLGLTKEERNIIKMAHEINAGNESFYQKLKIDTESVKYQAAAIIMDKWISKT